MTFLSILFCALWVRGGSQKDCICYATPQRLYVATFFRSGIGFSIGRNNYSRRSGWHVAGITFEPVGERLFMARSKSRSHGLTDNALIRSC